VVQIAPCDRCSNLKKLLADPAKLEDFSFRALRHCRALSRFGVMPQPLFCTKIASRLARTYTDKHGLKDVTRDLWASTVEAAAAFGLGSPASDGGPLAYAASDVLHLHALRTSSMPADPRKQGRTGQGLLRVPAHPRPARPRRLGC
jgi:ribonuclease D